MENQRADRHSRHRGHTKSQLAILEAAFLENNYATGERKAELAETTKLTESQVKFWFSERRKREKAKLEKDTAVDTNYSSADSRHRGHTKAQLAILEAAFLENNIATGERKKELAEATKLTKNQIKNWFLTRRKKEQVELEKSTVVATDSSQRTQFSQSQIDTLELAFKENDYVEGERKVHLAAATNLTKKQVSNWFINRRRKDSGHSNWRKAKVSGITKPQRDVLEAAFTEENYLDWEKRDSLAEKTGLTKAQVAEWFSSHRRKLKRWENAGKARDNVKSFDVTPAQETVLIGQFLKHRFLNMGELADMMKQTMLEEEQVKEWFRRQRELKKDNVEIKEEPEDNFE